MANMKNNGRQYPLWIMQDIDFQDLTNGTASSLELALPTNSIVVGGGVLVEVAWNSATTAVLDIGTSTANNLVNDANLRVAGYTPFTGAMVANYNGANAKMTLAETGATATQGRGKVFLQYLVVDKLSEVQVS